jgi:hypothetical protein
MMEAPFPKTVSFAKKYSRLLDLVKASDTLGILINADPDSMASAMALKRIFWRKAKQVSIYRVNSIKRADNLACVKFLARDQKHIRYGLPVSEHDTLQLPLPRCARRRQQSLSQQLMATCAHSRAANWCSN